MRALLVSLLLLGAAACTSGTTGPAASPSTTPAPSSTVAPSTPTNAPEPEPATTDRQQRVIRLLGRVRITARRPFVAGYHRSLFGQTWTDAYDGPGGRNGCRTRDDVLRRQLSHVRLRFDDPRHCRVYSGDFTDPYTGVSFAYRGNWLRIEIDHVVPLAAAWHNGAATWPQATRVAFANDVRRNLLATTRSANQDKVSRGPDRWLPPATAHRCDYVLRYLSVSVHYDLSVSADEVAAIRRVARHRC